MMRSTRCAGRPRARPAPRAAVAALCIWGSLAGLALADETASSGKTAGGGAIERCLCARDRAALLELRGRVAGAPSVAEARSLAAESTQQARVALGRARHFAFFDGGSLDSAYQRLVSYEARVAQAPTPEAVAHEFDGLLLADASGSVRPQVDVNVNTSGGGCTYSTGEVIAIVLGLILGIIPGLILLILLC